MDTGDLNLPAYKYQLEQVEASVLIVPHLFTSLQVELALKANPDDPELLKLQKDLEVQRSSSFTLTQGSLSRK